MDRKLLIKIHMYLAAFFAPAVLLVAMSGGLYLLGVKGTVEQETIYSSSEIKIDSKSASLKADVAALLASAGVTSYSFEYEIGARRNFNDVRRMSALGCDFNRSTQHFIGKPFPGEYVIESK